jgi:hypothetical protein
MQSKINRFMNSKHHLFNEANLPNIQIDTVVHHLVGKLSDLLIKSPTENISSIPVHIAKASVLLSTLTDGDIEQQKHLLSHFAYDYLQSKIYAEVATQVTIK